MTNVRRLLSSALGFEPSEEQWAVIAADLDPTVVVAGAGSGKTACMAGRVGFLVAEGLTPPEEVLGLTFTTKATAELLSRMRHVLAQIPTPELDDEDPAGDPNVQTYHAFSARIVSEHGIRLGIEPGATVLTDGTRHQLAYRTVCRTSAAFTSGRPIELTGDLLALDDELTELNISTDQLRAFDHRLIADLTAFDALQRTGEDLLATSQRRLLMADLVDQWRAAKLDRGVLDFADQIRLAGELVTRYPDIVDELRARYRFVLLDEYQDTSIAQRRMLQAAFGGGHSVLAVGDPAQAIYGWRGASVDNIDSFRRHFPTASGKPAGVLSLMTNRRSGAGILGIANEVSAQLRAAHGIEQLAADPARRNGVVECALLHTHADEVEWVASRVQECPPGQVKGQPTRWAHIAVLCARREDVSAVDAALRQRGVPTHVVGAASLLDQPAAVELRAMLEAIHDPTANPAFVRLAAGPRWRIGARDLAALGDRAAHLAGGRHRSDQSDLATALDDAVAGSDVVESVSLTEALADLGPLDAYSDAAVERFGAMSAELRYLRAHVGEPLPDFLQRVLRTSGLSVEVSLADDAVSEQQQYALSAMVDLAAEFTALDGRFTLGAYLSYLRDAERFDIDLDLTVTGPDDAVRLLTVHKAKGLEFPVVFVPFMSEGAWPGGRGRSQWTGSASKVPWPIRDDASVALSAYPVSGQSPRDKDRKAYQEVLADLAGLEDRRLAYVAFTRAMDRLVVSGHWWGPRQVKPRGPAEYLATVHTELVGLGSVGVWVDAPADGTQNPAPTITPTPVPWPAALAAERFAMRAEVAREVAQMAAHQPALPGLSAPAGLAQIDQWDLLMGALIEEARARSAGTRTVPLPASVSASTLMRALKEPDQVALDLVRPMPRPPAPAARRGTAFHAWVETRFGQQSLLDPDDLPGSADEGIGSDEVLEQLKAQFAAGPWAERDPVAVEVPFALVLGGRVVNGRIDAVFEADGRFDVVDWKTGSDRSTDPVQLAVYRLAWSRLRDVPIESVDAGFVMVATGEVLRPDTDEQVSALLHL